MLTEKGENRNVDNGRMGRDRGHIRDKCIKETREEESQSQEVKSPNSPKRYSLTRYSILIYIFSIESYLLIKLNV